nr:centrosomal protein of 72 kDa-like [Nerophis lumbriciformis]
MAPVTLVALTEEWIMNKLGLPHKRLGDVRSLSLPGNYKQKIGSLGNGLANFGRLKSLNLAHNSLVSVEGVQHLKQLNILNLYYNCIPSIKEVKVLFELPALRDLDLRLNPIAKIEPHYRPYVVHAMDNLRKLDGYPVKHFERQAAKKQFSQQSKSECHFQKSYCKPLEELLELMDKHWVGERTLQLDTNFLIQIVQILSMMENHISNQEAKVMNLKKEVGAWCVFAATQERDHDADMKKVTANLDELNMQLRTALEENVALQRELRMSQQAQRTVDELRIQVEKP